MPVRASTICLGTITDPITTHFKYGCREVIIHYRFTTYQDARRVKQIFSILRVSPVNEVIATRSTQFQNMATNCNDYIT